MIWWVFSYLENIIMTVLANLRRVRKVLFSQSHFFSHSWQSFKYKCINFAKLCKATAFCSWDLRFFYHFKIFSQLTAHSLKVSLSVNMQNYCQTSHVSLQPLINVINPENGWKIRRFFSALVLIFASTAITEGWPSLSRSVMSRPCQFLAIVPTLSCPDRDNLWIINYCHLQVQLSRPCQ